MEHIAQYDFENNILIATYKGELKSEEDVDFLMRKNAEEFEKIGRKVWFVVNLSEIKVSNPKLIKYYADMNKDKVELYAHGAFTYTSKALFPVMTHLYNVSTKNRIPFFKTKEEVIEHIKNAQKDLC